MQKVIAVAAGTLLLPALVAAQSSINIEDVGIIERPLVEGQVVPDVSYVHNIQWTDDGSGPYTVWVSDSQITDAGADNVFVIGTGIPERQQQYEYPIHTPFAAGAVSNFYAVSGGDVTATTSATGGNATHNEPLFWFLDAPFIDGDLSDWTHQPISILSSSNFVNGESDGDEDLSLTTAMGIDADAIYMQCDVTDDIRSNALEDGPGVWQGDGCEWYIGYYDIRPSTPRHIESQCGAETDWQFVIAYNAVDGNRAPFGDGGETCADNFNSGMLIGTGIDLFASGETLADENWRVEASIPHDGLVIDRAVRWNPTIGDISPATIAVNDQDDPAGGRQGQPFWGQDAFIGEAWHAPASWENTVTIYDPKVFGLGLGGGPTAVEENSWGALKNSVQ